MQNDPPPEGIEYTVIHFQSEQKPEACWILDVAQKFLAVQSTYCLEVRPCKKASGCDWRNFVFSDQLGAPRETVSGTAAVKHVVADRAWRRGKYSDNMRWGQDAPKKTDKKNSILLRYDNHVAHDKEEDFTLSPLDKLTARYQSALLRTRLRQQRVSVHLRSRSHDAKASLDEVLPEDCVEDASGSAASGSSGELGCDF